MSSQLLTILLVKIVQCAVTECLRSFLASPVIVVNFSFSVVRPYLGSGVRIVSALDPEIFESLDGAPNQRGANFPKQISESIAKIIAS